MNDRPGASKHKPTVSNRRQKIYEIIFEAETPIGKRFDEFLIATILLSIVVVMLDSVEGIKAVHGETLFMLEWGFTILFTIEYILRLISVRRTLGYATSFFGIVDLLAIVPTYLSLLLPGSQYLIVIRVLRLLRIFRVLKLSHYLSEADLLMKALQASRRKIIVFIFTVLNLVIILGSIMYVVEGENPGFSSIPTSVYWSIITLTTVGYGDIVPQTGLGQAIASVVMIIGYGIIAVPTGIVTAEISYAMKRQFTSRVCPSCSREGHDPDSKFCKFCSAELT